MSNQPELNVEQPNFEEMGVGDWKEYLREHPERCLVINAPDGVHTVQYERHEDRVMFFANGSMGYDEDGTGAVLDDVAGSDGSGLQVQTVEETYGDSDG